MCDSQGADARLETGYECRSMRNCYFGRCLCACQMQIQPSVPFFPRLEGADMADHGPTSREACSKTGGLCNSNQSQLHFHHCQGSHTQGNFPALKFPSTRGLEGNFPPTLAGKFPSNLCREISLFAGLEGNLTSSQSVAVQTIQADAAPNISNIRRF